jgi:hypothetical protein
MYSYACMQQNFKEKSPEAGINFFILIPSFLYGSFADFVN